VAYSEESIRRLQDLSSLGDEMVRFREGSMGFLDNNVLSKMEHEVFAGFVGIDASNTERVIELQKILWAINKIRTRIDDIISEGIVAREELKALNEDFD